MKKKGKKSRIGVKYINKDEKESNDMDSNEFLNFHDFYIQKNVPLQKHLRSEYFYKAIFLIETYLVDPKKDLNLKEVVEISKKWRIFSINNKNILNMEHKLLLFVIRARLDYLISRKNDNIYLTEEDDLKREELQEFLKDNKKVSECSVLEFWRKLKLISTRFYSLRYTTVFDRYFERLYLQLGKFFSYSSNNGKIFNDPVFCDYDKENKMYNINKYFIEMSEFDLNGIQVQFELYRECIIPNLDKLEGKMEIKYEIKKRKILLDWLFQEVQGNFLEPSEKKVQEYMYLFHVNPGEEERFKHEEKHADPTPYNIISKFRRVKFDELADVFEVESPLSDLIKKYDELFDKLLEAENKEKEEKEQIEKSQKEKENDFNIFDDIDLDGNHTNTSNHPNFLESEFENEKKKSKFQFKSDIDLIAICIPMLTFAFSKLFPGSSNFEETFLIKSDFSKKENCFIFLKKLIFDEVKQTTTTTMKLTKKIPIFVHIFNEVFLLYQTKFIRCHDFLSCYIHWVKLCCEDRSVNGQVTKNISLIEQYKLIFPENEKIYNDLKQKENVDFVEIKEKFESHEINLKNANNNNNRTIQKINTFKFEGVSSLF